MKLGILGAGPKALAIAAKKVVLSELGFPTPEIVVFEKSEVAAHWNGRSGFTNGKLPLGTSPEKDVGFPYASFFWGTHHNTEVNLRMQRYSWTNFLIENYLYADWIDRGKPAPIHKRWSEYLLWVYEKIAPHITLRMGEVDRLTLKNQSWLVRSQGPEDHSTYEVEGLVITGPGKSRGVKAPEDPRILSFENFWLHYKEYLSKTGKHFAIVGTGENAATVATTLGLFGEDLTIDIISPMAMNYTRGESYVENHVYTDPFQGNWFQLTIQNRKDFIHRTDRGVFSMVTKQQLDHMESVHVIPGRLNQIEVDPLNQLFIEVEYNQSKERRCYDFVVLAHGFDPFEMVTDLLDAESKEALLKQTKLPHLSYEAIESAIGEDMGIENLQPKLHLPMISGIRQGPGYANLSCLGRLSDQILSSYVTLDLDITSLHE